MESMSNRILAFLILLGFGGAIYGFYLYFYVYYNWNIEIQTNLENYEIILYSDTVKRTFSKDCDTLSCVFVGLPPVDYTLVATATGYVDLKQNVNIPKNNIIALVLNFEKEISLKNISDRFSAKLSPEQKIAAFKSKKLYKLIDNKAWVYYVTRQNGTINITAESWNIASFDDFTWTKRDITIAYINWTSDNIWIKVWNKNYIYHLSYKQLSAIEVANIKYIKKSWEYWFSIVADNSLYEYVPNSNVLSLREEVEDFVVFNEQKIYLNQQSSSTNIETPNKILLSTNTKLDKIYLENNQIYLEDRKANIYTLEWYQ